MIVLLSFGLLLLTTGLVLRLASLEGRRAYRTRHVAHTRIEWEKREAERRLHDLSREAFDSMLEAARQAGTRPYQEGASRCRPGTPASTFPRWTGRGGMSAGL